MKKYRKIYGFILVFLLVFIPALRGDAAAKKNRFETKKGVTCYYNEKGKKVKGRIIEIKGASYCFDKNGAMIKGWVKKKKEYYYFDRKSGKLQKNKKVDGIKLKKNGTAKKTKEAVEKIKTMITAREVVAKITKPTDKRSVKISACCKYVMAPPYVRYRFLKPIMNDKGWESTFANDIFKKGKGDCVSQSCALAFLAKECGVKEVYVCHDTSHSWAQLDGKVYDTLFAKAKKDHAYLNVTYAEFKYNGITKAPYKRKV